MTIEREREHLVQVEPTMIMTSAGEVFQVAADRRGYQMLTSRKASPASPRAVAAKIETERAPTAAVT